MLHAFIAAPARVGDETSGRISQLDLLCSGFRPLHDGTTR